jgi:diguanylate cyclase (GGDEF)-like protein
MGWLFYTMTYRAMAEKTQQRFMDSAGKVERELNLWFAGRQHDLQVFANSFILIDNLTKYQDMENGKPSSQKSDQVLSPVKKISGYLDLVRQQFAEYKRLAVFDMEGREVAASDAETEDIPFELPSHWKEKIEKGKAVIGDVTFSKDQTIPLAVIGIPLISDQSRNKLGVLAVQVSLRDILPFLRTMLSGRATGPRSVHLVQKDGSPILAVSIPEGQKVTALSASQKMELFMHPFVLKDFNNNNKWIVGFAMAFRDLPWGLVITESYDYVYSDVIRMRDQIILTAILFALIIGLGASIVAKQILQPLKALTGGVMRVAEGDLDISLDIIRNDELGIVSSMFNEMVVHLKQNKEELERLAVTDVLTRLANRKQIMTVLNNHIEEYRRYGHDFSVLMVDIDHFKMVNDTHGHLVGDSVLVQVAQVFKKLLRTLDVAGRYGGEEFLIILGQTETQKAVLTAERIRLAVESYPFVYQDVELHLTISIGIAGITSSQDTDNSLIGRADDALYKAKAAGRNKVVLNDETRAS